MLELQAGNGGAQVDSKRLMLAAVWRERKMFGSVPSAYESLPQPENTYFSG